ncbi:MAG: SIMPL domain-containing protein [Acidobacteria bacterium]|nr:SIMPL domain-containing protein [Acidobacteriota bacterium]
MLRRVCILLLALAALAAAQTNRTIQATGTATVTANPDQASLDVGVVTTGATAQDSAAQNAIQTSAVINALKTVLAGNGTIQTQYYSVSPRYVPNSSTISGYTTNNTLHVTATDLSILGKLIDAANGAGANSVSGISFGLQNSDPFMQQALAAAAKQAVAHAGAIAGGLGGTVGPVLSAQEGGSYTPVAVSGAAAGAGVSTPMETGTVKVSATVTLVVQLQ